MLWSQPFHDLRELRLSAGAVRYREAGNGPVLLFLHGLFTNGNLWRMVAPPLAAQGYRCIVPDWPLGSHTLPMDGTARLDPPALADLVVEFMARLDLSDVTLIGNDTGGAIAQLIAAGRRDRVERLVLTGCDAFERFPPRLFSYLKWGAHIPGMLYLMAQPLRFPMLHRLPITFGWLTKRPIEPVVIKSYLGPAVADPAVRRDTGKLLRGVHKRHTLAAARRLPDFPGPVLIAWAREDRIFPVADATRLANVFRDARVELIEDSYTLVSEDQPERLVAVIGDFLRKTDAADGPAQAAG